MHAQKLPDATGEQTLPAYPVNSTDANPMCERQTRFTKALNVLKKAVPVAVLPVLVAGAFSATIPAVPAYASATTLTLTAYPQNSTGVPMVAEALTNHVLRGTPDAINIFVNGAVGTGVQVAPVRDRPGRAPRPDCFSDRRRRPTWDRAVHVQCHCFSDNDRCSGPSHHHLPRDHLHIVHGVAVFGHARTRAWSGMPLRLPGRATKGISWAAPTSV